MKLRPLIKTSSILSLHKHNITLINIRRRNFVVHTFCWDWNRTVDKFKICYLLNEDGIFYMINWEKKESVETIHSSTDCVWKYEAPARAFNLLSFYLVCVYSAILCMCALPNNFRSNWSIFIILHKDLMTLESFPLYRFFLRRIASITVMETSEVEQNWCQ
jgi:hypothetical protein